MSAPMTDAKELLDIADHVRSAADRFRNVRVKLGGVLKTYGAALPSETVDGIERFRATLKTAADSAENGVNNELLQAIFALSPEAVSQECEDCGGSGVIEPDWGVEMLDKPYPCPKCDQHDEAVANDPRA